MYGNWPHPDLCSKYELFQCSFSTDIYWRMMKLNLANNHPLWLFFITSKVSMVQPFFSSYLSANCSICALSEPIHSKCLSMLGPTWTRGEMSDCPLHRRIIIQIWSPKSLSKLLELRCKAPWHIGNYHFGVPRYPWCQHWEC